MFFGPILFILLIICLAFVFISPNQGYHGHSNCHSSTHIQTNRALDILKERYAKGEITEEEYIKTKRNLEQ